MATTNTFAQTGAVFNDATTRLEGGLWQSNVNEGGQGLGSIGSVVADLQSVRASVLDQIASGQFTGDTLAHVQSIAAALDQEVAAAKASVNGGGAFGSVAAAETALHTLHLGVLDTVKADANLAALATADGATGFQSVPAAFAPGTNAHNAPHATLADIGGLFNDAANKMIGGVNADNAAAIRADIRLAKVNLEHLIKENPDDFTGLTGVHAETVVRQLALETKFIDQAATNPVAGRASNDNMLDIIDIIQGDEALAAMANQGGLNGFAAFPDKIGETPKYQDNAAQTAFWGKFIAQSNALGTAAQTAVANGDRAETAHLIKEIKAFEKESAAFDQSQGGIFGARFDNELAKNSSTLGAEVDAMIKGLKTGNAVLIAAAAEEMHTNAADVGGNNISVDGKAYNTDGMTIAEVLGVQPAPGGTPVPGDGGAHAGDHHGDVVDAHPHEMQHHQQHHVDHFGHMWG